MRRPPAPGTRPLADRAREADRRMEAGRARMEASLREAYEQGGDVSGGLVVRGVGVRGLGLGGL